jgi:hypothetical protein
MSECSSECYACIICQSNSVCCSCIPSHHGCVTWQRKPTKEDDIHVVPEFEGEPKHFDTVNCWCEPEFHYQDENTQVRVFTHRRPE